MFLLILNPMTTNVEAKRVIAKSETHEALENFLDQERLESRGEDGYHRTFREGPLYWFNGPDKYTGIFDVGVPPLESPDGNYPFVVENDKYSQWTKPLRDVPEIT